MNMLMIGMVVTILLCGGGAVFWLMLRNDSKAWKVQITFASVADYQEYLKSIQKGEPKMPEQITVTDLDADLLHPLNAAENKVEEICGWCGEDNEDACGCAVKESTLKI